MTKVLIVTADVLREKMAGPAIRAWEIAKELSRSNEVRLVSTSKATVERPGIGFTTFAAPSNKDLRPHVDWCDVLVLQGLLLSSHTWVADANIKIVADLYDPMHLEQLEQSAGKPIDERSALVAHTSDALDVQIRRADMMMCASQNQRYFWLGQMAANGRLNPYNYDRDGMFSDLLKIVPFGVESVPPVQISHGIRGVVPGIEIDDEVLIWGGGIYNWFDPISLIHAMKIVRSKRPKAKLFFMGSGHPNPDVPQMAVAAEAHELAEELGLLGKSVFFNEGWVPYDQRADYLLDADLGVSTHHLHVETEFSFRTRILDYLWAGLPMIVTEGDGFAQIVERENLGTVVVEKDPIQLADAIVTLLKDSKLRSQMAKNVNRVAESFTWSRVLTPLVEYCNDPYVAADRAVAHRPVTHAERELRSLKLQLDMVHSSAVWKIVQPLRRLYSAVRHRFGLNPTAAELAIYLNNVGDSDPSVRELVDSLQKQRTD